MAQSSHVGYRLPQTHRSSTRIDRHARRQGSSKFLVSAGHQSCAQSLLWTEFTMQIPRAHAQQQGGGGTCEHLPLTSCCASGKQTTSVDTQDSTCCQLTSCISRTSCKRPTDSSGPSVTKTWNNSPSSFQNPSTPLPGRNRPFCSV